MLRAINREQKRGFSTSFGVTIKERTFAAQNTRYQFNGKEYDSETETSYFGARNSDGDLGIWGALDPITHAMYSPYSSFDNNPIYYADPTGADSEGGDDLNTKKKDVKLEKVNDGIHKGVIVEGNPIGEKAVAKVLTEMSKKIGKEISAYVIKDDKENYSFFVMDYSENEANKSKNQPVDKGRETILLNGKSYEILAQVHSHTSIPLSSDGKGDEPSQEDANAATWFNKPVYVVGHKDVSKVPENSGNLSYRYYKLNKEGNDYEWTGNVFKKATTNDLIKGNFSIIKDLQNEN